MRNSIFFLLTILLTASWSERSQAARGFEYSDEWRSEWTMLLRAEIRSHSEIIKLIPSDAERICPRISKLTFSQKEEFLIFLFHAIIAAESGFDPYNRTEEPPLGQDPITGLPVFSEGLLQLSYQDINFDQCKFDYEHDKALPIDDPARTIFSPILQFECSVRILLAQFKDTGKLTPSTYWSTLTPPADGSPWIVEQQFKQGAKACFK